MLLEDGAEAAVAAVEEAEAAVASKKAVVGGLRKEADGDSMKTGEIVSRRDAEAVDADAEEEGVAGEAVAGATEKLPPTWKMSKISQVSSNRLLRKQRLPALVKAWIRDESKALSHFL